MVRGTRPSTTGRRLLLAFALLAAALGVAEPTRAAAATPMQSGFCLGSLSTGELNALFAGRVDDNNGMDSLRVFALPDGRFLWLVQDAFLSRDGNSRSLMGNVFAHNAAL